MKPAELLQNNSHRLFAASAGKADFRSRLPNLLTGGGGSKCAQELFGHGLFKRFAERSLGTQREVLLLSRGRVAFVPPRACKVPALQRSSTGHSSPSSSPASWHLGGLPRPRVDPAVCRMPEQSGVTEQYRRLCHLPSARGRNCPPVKGEEKRALGGEAGVRSCSQASFNSLLPPPGTCSSSSFPPVSVPGP